MGAAIVGVGLAGSTHLAALTAVGVPVAGVLSATPERARTAAARWRVAAYDNLDELLADPAVDAVHVCVPTAEHRSVVEAAVDAEKAVLCEKPLALDASEAALLARRAGTSGVLARVGFNHRFDAGIQLLRRLVGDGELGRLINVWGRYEQAFNAAPSSLDWRFDTAAIGATRVVSELGSHWFDLVHHVTGSRLVRVSPLLSDRLGPRQVAVADGAPERLVTPPNEDAFAALLEYDNGVTGSVYATELAHGTWDDIEVRLDGSRASARWSSQRPNQVTVANKRDGDRVLGSPSPAPSFDALMAEFHGLTDTAIAATFEEGLDNCAAIDAVAAGGRARVGWVSALAGDRISTVVAG